MPSVAIALSILAAYAALRLSFLRSEPASMFTSLPAFEPVDVTLKDGQAALQRFSEGLRFQTVSNPADSNHFGNSDSFNDLHSHIELSYPLVHEQLHVEKACSHFCCD